jgi:hypothetical protein
MPSCHRGEHLIPSLGLLHQDRRHHGDCEARKRSAAVVAPAALPVVAFDSGLVERAVVGLDDFVFFVAADFGGEAGAQEVGDVREGVAQGEALPVYRGDARRVLGRVVEQVVEAVVDVDVAVGVAEGLEGRAFGFGGAFDDVGFVGAQFAAEACQEGRELGAVESSAQLGGVGEDPGDVGRDPSVPRRACGRAAAQGMM